MPNPAPPLAYASPIDPVRRRFSWLVCISTAVVLLALELLALCVIPRIEVVFSDFRMDLPIGTKIMLDISRAFHEWGWASFLLFPAGLGFLWPMLFRRRDRADIAAYIRLTDRLIATLIVSVAVLVVLIVVMMLVMLPMFALLHGISAQSGH